MQAGGACVVKEQNSHSSGADKQFRGKSTAKTSVKHKGNFDSTDMTEVVSSGSGAARLPACLQRLYWCGFGVL